MISWKTLGVLIGPDRTFEGFSIQRDVDLAFIEERAGLDEDDRLQEIGVAAAKTAPVLPSRLVGADAIVRRRRARPT